MTPVTKAAIAAVALVAGYVAAVEIDGAFLDAASQQIAGDYRPMTPPMNRTEGLSQ
jgi:hypothetical protein